MSVELSGDHGLSLSDSDEDDPSCSDSLSDIESDEVCHNILAVHGYAGL